jgi:hypothetical protein
MKNQKISKEELVKFIQEEALKLKNQLNEEFEKVGQAHEVKMDRVAKPSDKDQALVMKTTEKTQYKKGPGTEADPYEGDQMTTEVEMTETGKPSDDDIKTAVYVKAGSKKGGNDVTTGQAKANFDSKTDGPKKEVSKPFVEKGKDKMNTMDKENYKGGSKTYVEAGAEDKSKNVTAGQHKANFSEKAPKSDKDERIAHGIELKENYTKEELKNLIISESQKLAKKIILKKELSKLQRDLKR